ncbi:DUF4743 domain-containing protein [Chitinibacteraceae bacterium HSL-7]
MMKRIVTEYLATQPAFDASACLKLVINDMALGHISHSQLEHIRAIGLFERQDDTLVGAGEWQSIGRTLQAWGEGLRDKGALPGWRNERYTVFAPDDRGWPDLNRPLFELERALFRTLGLTSRAVHINGYTMNQALWVATRAGSKAVDPGLRDNLAAGGMAAGESATSCVQRELWEEAGVPERHSANARLVETLRSTRLVDDGVHDEVLYVFDLLLPGDFTPVNTDGEVAGFEQMPIDDVAGKLSTMTWDAGLVTAHFLLRHD